MDTDKIVGMVVGGIGAAAALFGLGWKLARSRHDRCEFRLSEFEVTYFAVPPGWTYNFIGEAARTAAPAPVGTWLRFSGRLINKGYQPGSVERIRVLLPSVPDNGEGAFPEDELRMPIHIEAHHSRDIRFRYHLHTDHTVIERLPEIAKCVVILEDQSERRHRSSFFATREESPKFNVRRRSH